MKVYIVTETCWRDEEINTCRIQKAFRSIREAEKHIEEIRRKDFYYEGHYISYGYLIVEEEV